MKQKNEVLANLKSLIIKLNDGLFWATNDSTKEFKTSEIIEIKNALVKAYEYIKEN